MEGSDSEFANFTLPTLKTFLEAHSQNVSGNKQELLACAIGCPKTHFFHELVIFWPAKKLHKDTFTHPPSPFPGNFCNCNSGGICTAPRFNFHCYTQHETMPIQKLAQTWRCDLSQLLAWKITKGIHSCKPASLNRPIGPCHHSWVPVIGLCHTPRPLSSLMGSCHRPMSYP